MDTVNNAISSTPVAPTFIQGGVSLRIKAIWMLVIFIVFTIVTGLIVNKERRHLYSDVQQLQAVHFAEENLLGIYMSVAQATMTVNENFKNEDVETASRRISVDIDKVLSGLYELKVSHPEITPYILKLKQNQVALSGPAPHLAFNEIRENLHNLTVEVSAINAVYANDEVHWLEEYNSAFDKLSYEWTFFAFIGVVTLSSLVIFFVSRLAWDIKRVQDRAMQIVEGYRGEPMVVTRNDELGALMECVNRMQLELRRQEVQVELSRQQEFHKEKMAAVGSIAAAVAHEINNPLSAIVGMSNEMCQMQLTEQCGNANKNCQPEMLQSHARRVMDITRQISEFSSPHSSEPKLYDLNNLIRTTAKFVSFDRRFRSVELELNLDSQLPAVFVEGDHVTQVLMNLLINSADATEGRQEPKPHITITSGSDQEGVKIVVTDNGPGIAPEILERVFDEFFTTKPAGKGTGIGLAVSRSLIESLGGSILITSEMNAGTTVTIRLPLTTDGLSGGKGGH